MTKYKCPKCSGNEVTRAETAGEPNFHFWCWNCNYHWWVHRGVSKGALQEELGFIKELTQRLYRTLTK